MAEAIILALTVALWAVAAFLGATLVCTMVLICSPTAQVKASAFLQRRMYDRLARQGLTKPPA